MLCSARGPFVRLCGESRSGMVKRLIGEFEKHDFLSSCSNLLSRFWKVPPGKQDVLKHLNVILIHQANIYLDPVTGSRERKHARRAAVSNSRLYSITLLIDPQIWENLCSSDLDVVRKRFELCAAFGPDILSSWESDGEDTTPPIFTSRTRKAWRSSPLNVMLDSFYGHHNLQRPQLVGDASSTRPPTSLVDKKHSWARDKTWYNGLQGPEKGLYRP